MTISPWLLLALAIPVLLLGETLVRRVWLFSRYNIPAPVVGGLIVATLVWIGNLLIGADASKSVEFSSSVTTKWWTWLVTPEADWLGKTPSTDVYRPFLVVFFTCIGLNASWELVRKGGVQVLIFLVISGALAVIQNFVGVALAKSLGVSSLLGIVCGSLTLTGGHATALGFASEFESAGLKGASVIGAAAATFGLVFGGLIGGPIGGWLIRRNNLKSSAPRETHLESGDSGSSGIISDLKALPAYGGKFLLHLFVLVVCLKVGAWISYYIKDIHFQFFGREIKIIFPIYMGSMLVGIFIRNILDLTGVRIIKTELVDTLGSVTLAVFLSIAMMSLKLIQLASFAGPMLIILAVQVVLMGAFAWFITFRLMGKDFDAAVMSSGHCGFGLGATSNAVANMKSLVETFGPAPRAFLVVPIVGAFLVDFLNAMTITIFLNAVK